MKLTRNIVLRSFLACVASLVSVEAVAAPIQLQNGTGTFSQLINGGPFSPD